MDDAALDEIVEPELSDIDMAGLLLAVSEWMILAAGGSDRGDVALQRNRSFVAGILGLASG